jgi:hypothetical protein
MDVFSKLGRFFYKSTSERLGIDWLLSIGGWMYCQSPSRKKGVEGEELATGSNPTDRGKAGSKRHLLTDGQGIPLAVILSGANRHDMKKLADLLDAVVIEVPDSKEVEQHLCLDRG